MLKVHTRRALLALCAVLAATLAAPTAGAAPATARQDDVTVTVGSFNIKSITFDRHPSRDWRARKARIVEQVLRENIHVMGIQEASWGRYTGFDYDDGPTQYLDLVGALNRVSGGDWRVTAKASFNCVNPMTPANCVKKNRGASGAQRILFDNDKLEKLSRGAKAFRHQGANPRHFVWARFRVRGSDREFLFTTTHIQPGNDELKTAQWRQALRLTKRKRGDLPVISTGDYNVQKYSPVARTMLPRTRDIGVSDVLGQRFATNPTEGGRAETLVNAWINSYNHNAGNVRQFSVPQRPGMVGNSLDWIFASDRLKVDRYEVVCDFDPKTGDVIGRLPSDHNLIKAVIRFP